MSDRPTVSTVITFWNRAGYLPEAIAGVLAQSLPPGATSELVMIDDGSDDSSADVARRAAPSARVVRQENQGVNGAANRGVREARGDHVAFCDSDDVWLPGKLAAQLAAMRDDVDLVFVHVEEFLSPELDPDLVRTRRLRAAMPGYIPSCMLARRDALERVGELDVTLGNGAWLDWCARARDAGLREVVLDGLFVRRRVHDTNNWTTQDQAGSGYLQALRARVHRQRETS